MRTPAAPARIWRVVRLGPLIALGSHQLAGPQSPGWYTPPPRGERVPGTRPSPRQVSSKPRWTAGWSAANQIASGPLLRSQCGTRHRERGPGERQDGTRRPAPASRRCSWLMCRYRRGQVGVSVEVGLRADRAVGQALLRFLTPGRPCHRRRGDVVEEDDPDPEPPRAERPWAARSAFRRLVEPEPARTAVRVPPPGPPWPRPAAAHQLAAGRPDQQVPRALPSRARRGGVRICADCRPTVRRTEWRRRG
jgi:hypothetical protein